MVPENVADIFNHQLGPYHVIISGCVFWAQPAFQYIPYSFISSFLPIFITFMCLCLQGLAPIWLVLCNVLHLRSKEISSPT